MDDFQQKVRSLFSPNGSVLILVLIVLAAMTMVSMALAYRVRLEIKIAQSFSQRTQAYYLALGGIERAKAHLASKNPIPANMSYFHSLNTTAAEEKLWDNLAFFSSQRAELGYHLIDEESLFNLNRSDPASWLRTAAVDKSLAAAILDWQDGDEQAEPEGAESDYYQTLQPPYLAKNKPFQHLRELLYLKDVTLQRYASQNQKSKNNGDSKINLGLTNWFTVYGSGKINLNTASQPILAALSGLDEPAAQAVINFRDGPDFQAATDDDEIFGKPEDIEQLEELSALQRELLKQYGHFESRHFRAISRANIGKDATCTLLAMLRIGDNDVEIVTLEKLGL